MNQREYRHRQHSIRKLFHRFKESPHRSRTTQYAYSLQYNSDIDMYHLWDEFNRKIVGTIKILPTVICVRYDDNWMFKDQLLKFKYNNRRKHVFIKSDNTNRHGSLIAGRTSPSCQANIEKRRVMLAEETRVNNLVFKQITMIRNNGRRYNPSAPSVITFKVSFDGEPSTDLTSRINQMLRELYYTGIFGGDSFIELSSEYVRSLYERNQSGRITEYRDQILRGQRITYQQQYVQQYTTSIGNGFGNVDAPSPTEVTSGSFYPIGGDNV